MFPEVNGAKLFVKRVPGKEGREIMALHGGPGSNHHSLHPALDPLSKWGEVVYYDHRGMGQSEGSDKSKWNLAQWADDAVSLAQALEIEKPVLLGHSFGGFVAQEIATRYPDFASALVLSSTSPREEEKEVVEAFFRIGGKEAGEAAAAFFAEQSDETWQRYQEKADPCYNTTEQPENQAAETDSEMLFHFWSKEHGEMNYLESLHKIVCPTLVVVGREDPITPWQLSLEIAGRLECSYELSVVDGAGHGVWRDRPEVFFPLLGSFIERHC